MPISIIIQLNKYKSYMDTLIKRMKKSNEQYLRDSYDYVSTEYLNLLSYALDPRISDEEYASLEIY
jgi:hypothetical protein